MARWRRLIAAWVVRSRGERRPGRREKGIGVSLRMSGAILRCESVSRVYRSGSRDLTVLKDISFSLEPGGFVAILGPSGSGKTTLLGLLAGLDRPTSGIIYLEGQDLGALSEDARARVRVEKIGFVFQSFQLIPTLTAQENVQVPLELRSDPGARQRAAELLTRVGLGGREHHYPSQLSGGEQQRVALARGFSIRPRLLFADEPTGNLDAGTGATIIELMVELNREFETALVLVTHDLELASRARRTIRLADGGIVADSAA
jgi:putative ABC transport system ATP-binding protein